MTITDDTILPPHMERMRQEWKARLTAEAEQQKTNEVSPSKLPSKMQERWALFNRIVDVDQRNLTDSEFRVLVTLFRDSKDGVAKIGQANLACRIGRTRETVSRCVGRLARKGLLEIVKQGGLITSGVTRETSQYRIK